MPAPLFASVGFLSARFLAQAGPKDVASWVPDLLQNGLAVWLIWWLTTKVLKALEEVLKSQREGHGEVAEALKHNTRSNLNVVLALKSLDKEHLAKQLATEHIAELDEEERRKRHESTDSGR